MAGVEELAKELITLRGGRGVHDKKFLERLVGARGLCAKWNIPIGDIQKKPEEIKERVIGQLRNQADWLDEMRENSNDGGKDHKQLGRAFRVALNVEEEPAIALLRERRENLASAIPVHPETIRNWDDEAIRLVATRLGESESQGDGFRVIRSAEPIPTYQIPDFRLDGWHFRLAAIHCDVESFERMKVYHTYVIEVDEDGLDRIGIFYGPVPGSDGSSILPVITGRFQAYGYEMTSVQLSRDLLHCTYGLGGRMPKGVLAHVACSFEFDGPLASSCTFSPATPCDLLVAGVKFNSEAELASSESYISTGLSVHAAPGIPASLVQEQLGKLYIPEFAGRGVSDIFFPPISKSKHLEPADESVYPYLVDYPNPRLGMHYGLVWSWPTGLILKTGRSAKSRFGQYLERQYEEDLRPPSEDGGGE